MFNKNNFTLISTILMYTLLKISKAFTLLAIMNLLIYGCKSNQYDKEIPNDFSFVLKDEITTFDSKTGVYSRQYMKGDSSVTVHLTKEEKQKIYDSFVNYDFLEFPNSFECDMKSYSMLPSFETKLHIVYKGESKNVSTITGCGKVAEQLKAEDDFYRLIALIHGVLHNKAEIKKMQKTDMRFM